MNQVLANKQIERELEDNPGAKEFWMKHFDGKLVVEYDELCNR